MGPRRESRKMGRRHCSELPPVASAPIPGRPSQTHPRQMLTRPRAYLRSLLHLSAQHTPTLKCCVGPAVQFHYVHGSHQTTSLWKARTASPSLFGPQRRTDTDKPGHKGEPVSQVHQENLISLRMSDEAEFSTYHQD